MVPTSQSRGFSTRCPLVPARYERCFIAVSNAINHRTQRLAVLLPAARGRGSALELEGGHPGAGRFDRGGPALLLRFACEIAIAPWWGNGLMIGSDTAVVTTTAQSKLGERLRRHRLVLSEQNPDAGHMDPVTLDGRLGWVGVPVTGGRIRKVIHKPLSRDVGERQLGPQAGGMPVDESQRLTGNGS